VQVDSLTDGCIRVNVNDATAYFDADGQPISVDDLIEGETVTVFAEVIAIPLEELEEADDASDDDASDDDHIGLIQLSAFVVHKGPPADLLSLDGVATTAVDGDSRFGFLVDAGEEIAEEEISVQIGERTRILSRDDLSNLDPDVIDDGVIAEVSGVLLPGVPEDPTSLSAALIVVGDSAPPAGSLTQLEGNVVSLDTDTFTLFTENEDPPGDRCVAPLPGARYIVVEDNDDGADHTEVDADYLAEGQEVTVFGAYADGGDCFEADTIIIDETETGSED